MKIVNITGCLLVLIFCVLEIPNGTYCANENMVVETILPTSFDWDMVIAHGKNLTFISVESNSSIEIVIPMPSNSVKLWGSNSAVTTTSSILPISQNLVNDWQSQDLMSLAYDSNEPNLVFFTQASRNLTSVAVFNLYSNITKLLFQATNAIIDGLTYHNNVLYWTETRAQIIMTLNNSKREPWELIEPIGFLKFNNRKVHGVAIDRETGYVYWANWASTDSSIEYYDGHEQKTLSLNNIAQPQSLSIYGSYLYWTNRPYGATFTIERINLKNHLAREVLYTGRYQAPFTIAPLCENSVMWTDVMSRSVLIENSTSKAIIFKHYTDSVPNGFFIKDRFKFNERICDMIGKGAGNKVTIIPEKDEQNKNKGKINNNYTNLNIEPVVSQKLDISNNSKIINKDKVDAEWCGNWENIRCLNGGSCISLDKKIFCLCPPSFSGPTCELYTAENSNSELSIPWNNPIIVGLLVIVILLTLISMFLGRKVHKLNRKPKIRRRVIVARGSESQQPSSVCEMIDIENCCNMNICETPCYDISSMKTNGPIKLGKSGDTFSSKEDKQRLIEEA